MIPPGQPIRINKQAVEADINVFKAKLGLLQTLSEADAERAKQERILVKEFITNGPNLHSALVRWTAAQSAHSDAALAAQEMELLQIRQKIAIGQAMLADADRQVLVPGGIKQ